jgi:hypothetical protein
MIAMLGSQTVKEPLPSRLLFPWTERTFTYAAYDDWLASLDDVRTVPHATLATETADAALAIRHDVDLRLDRALDLARMEYQRGVRSTYFVLHTAPYYRSGDAQLLATLRRIQDDYRHEIGLHNDLLTLQRVHGMDISGYLGHELEWLRAGGIQITGTASHGSVWCYRLGFHNNYVFAGWDEPVAGFPATEVAEKLDPTAFGLEYEAYHLEYDAYFSDSSFASGRRWHPREARLGRRTVVLIHPCHWDPTVAAKTGRFAGRAARRLLRGGRPDGG